MTRFFAWWDRPQDLVSSGVRWMDLTPTDWHQPQLTERGSLQPFETELFREDGSLVPVLIGVATLEQGGYQVSHSYLI